MKKLDRRRFLKTLGHATLGAFGCASLSQAASVSAGPSGGRKPNFVFILIDDLGWTDLTCYGSAFYETPNTDRLAAQGMKFTDAYAACPVCSPTRASILTGKYPARLHLTDWIPGHSRPYAKLRVPQFNQQLPLKEVTIAEALKAAGYVSASFGKWHLGGKSFYPENQGFDLNFGGDHRGQPPSYFYPYRIPNVLTGQDGEYLTDRLTDEAEGFIEKNKDRLFFLYLSHYAVHTPLQAKPEMIAKYREKLKPDGTQKNPTYAAMIQSVDESVGRVLRKLDELKLADNTVVIFMSDNGGLIPVTSNHPLRAGKGTMYEGGIREPMIIRWPRVVEPGNSCSVPVTSVDFYPTILEIAGITDAVVENVDGVSLVPLLKRTRPLQREAIFWHYPHYHPGGATPCGAVRQGDFKLIEFYEDDRLELYDLKRDLGERNNLAAKTPEMARRLHQTLRGWRQAVNAQMPTPNPDHDPARQGQRTRGVRTERES
jgi:arylsulfatase A